MTLWGTAAGGRQPSQAQSNNNRVYLADLPPEAPTHHALDQEALKTWVYPTNLGPIRDYQFSIVKNGLFHNTLVALPTGLGKTFIAATVMLNFYRWTQTAKIVFVAPTKPLASQQVAACLSIAGLPRSRSTLLTGETSPALREEEWRTRRLFFMTPQTLQNDLSKGYADPKSIVLLVVDEAHRATGDYSYVKVVEFIRRFSKSFRVLALTATPGSSVEGVQKVIDNLNIAHVEIRTEESIDIRQYVHTRHTDRMVLELSDEILHIQELYSKALKPLCDKLGQQNIWYGKDPMGLTAYGLVKAQQEWNAGPARHLNQGTRFMLQSIFTILSSLAHSIKLLNFHGIKPFHDFVANFRSEAEAKGDKGSKYKRQLLGDASFQEMMDTVEKWLKLDGFVGHPKLTYLCDKLLNHFMDAGAGSNTRAIVFSEFRDSAEEIVRVLNMHKPLLKASMFVGQADTKRGAAGMKQKDQIQTIEKFKEGVFNVLVATSIGEEGLDIGQVDLIICYDASASPIRMLQRMGRTGRKRAGQILLLLMKGKEEEKYDKAVDNYEQMQTLICEGSEFNFRHDLSSRIVPRDIRPEVDKRDVEIPIENTQNTSLPEPKKPSGRVTKKATKKKFNMPDGVETGFTAASLLGQAGGLTKKSKPKPKPPTEMEILADIPDLNSVLLSPSRREELDRLYRDTPSGHAAQEEIGEVSLMSHPILQRRLLPTFKLKHGAYTKRCVRLFRRMGELQHAGDTFEMPHGQRDGSRYKQLPVPPFAEDTERTTGRDFLGETSGPQGRSAADDADPFFTEEELEAPPPKKRKTAARPKPQSKAPARKKPRTSNLSDLSEGLSEDDDEGEDLRATALPPQRGRRGAPKKRAPKHRTAADPFEGRGDDCMRTSDNYESDGSDSGADLVDFIVGDDEVTSSMRREQEGFSSSLPVSSLPRAPEVREKPKGRVAERGPPKADPFFVPTLFTPSQDSDEEMPDVSTLAGRKRTAGAAVVSDDDGIIVSKARTRNRRPQFIDSDDTE